MQFWKQFFEASANISLTSYEEENQDETFVTQTTETHDQHDGIRDGQEEGETITTTEDHDPPTATHIADDSLEDSLLSSPSVRNGRTPKQLARGERNAHAQPQVDDTQRSLFSQPGGRQNNPTTPSAFDDRTRNMAETPGRPSPFLRSEQPTTSRKQQQHQQQQHGDVLLHRVLDKTYRVQATPHSARKTTGRSHAASRDDSRTQTRSLAFDSSPISPELAAPQLRSEIFGSPAKSRKAAPPTPGVSVQQGKGKTPRRGSGPSSARKTLFTKEATKTPQQNDHEWDIDDDDTSDFDYGMGMSPPKTMQFHVPQSRLLQTPAKEASKRIVEELMLTAGAGDVTNTLSELQIDETRYAAFDDNQYDAALDDSPSVVKVARDVDDSF